MNFDIASLEQNTLAIETTLKRLQQTMKSVDRTLALVNLTKRHSPYYPLVWTMCRLGLIKDWPV